jgi:hypothetical protein
MPEQRTIERARKAKRKGKAASTQAGEFIREEIHYIREGKRARRNRLLRSVFQRRGEPGSICRRLKKAQYRKGLGEAPRVLTSAASEAKPSRRKVAPGAGAVFSSAKAEAPLREANFQNRRAPLRADARAPRARLPRKKQRGPKVEGAVRRRLGKPPVPGRDAHDGTGDQHH